MTPGIPASVRLKPATCRVALILFAKYEHEHLPAHPELMGALGELRGKVLGCWCSPKPCHGDVLARLANAS
jgi:Domain of unknown function (DUF4326)